MTKCSYCGKEYSIKGMGTHIWRTHGDGKSHNSNKGYKGGRIAWNKGLTIKNSDSLKRMQTTLKEGYKEGRLVQKNKFHSIETRKKISLAISKNNKGGRCKWFDHIKPNGQIVKVQGTWEQRFAKIADTLDECWIKPGTGSKDHTYEWIDQDGIIHNYTPDFYFPSTQTYYEIKGFWWGNDKFKMETVYRQYPNLKIILIQLKELKELETR